MPWKQIFSRRSYGTPHNYITIAMILLNDPNCTRVKRKSLRPNMADVYWCIYFLTIVKRANPMMPWVCQLWSQSWEGWDWSYKKNVVSSINLNFKGCLCHFHCFQCKLIGSHRSTITEKLGNQYRSWFYCCLRFLIETPFYKQTDLSSWKSDWSGLGQEMIYIRRCQ